MVILELEDLVLIGVVFNFWVEELGIFDALAVKVLVYGRKTRFSLGENEREETVIAPPIQWL